MKLTKTAFTTPEVLFALVVVTIFVTGGFQLYSIVHSSNMIITEQNHASSIAYEHLRQIANAITIEECPINHNDVITKNVIPFEDDYKRLPGLKIRSTLSAPYTCPARIMKIEVVVDYKIGNTEQTEKQALYVQK